MITLRAILIVCWLISIPANDAHSTQRSIIPAKPLQRRVDNDTLRRIYEQVKTPHKYGVVLKAEQGRKADCPSVYRFDNKWYMMYIIFDGNGYETDPLAVGIACTTDPGRPVEWNRLGRPVLSRDQADVREFENLTQYKSNIIYDRRRTLGYPFVMFYNGKSSSGYERIGMAVSKDMRHWLRYGNEPVIDNGSGISGDPQIARIDDVWVMFYFGAFWKPKAFDTFACSYDLVHWTKWQGPDLVAPSEPYDDTYAHKPWVIKYKDIVYHFYCAVGDQGRVIALATSKDLKSKTAK